MTEPPAIMWMEHDQIREQKKQLHKLIADLKTSGFDVFKQQLWETAKTLSNLLSNHFYKENNILFPAAMSVVTEAEWVDVRKEFDEIGYCCFTPPELTAPASSKAMAAQAPSIRRHPELRDGQPHQRTARSPAEHAARGHNLRRCKRYGAVLQQARETVLRAHQSRHRQKSRQCATQQKSLHIVSRIVESFKTWKEERLPSSG